MNVQKKRESDLETLKVPRLKSPGTWKLEKSRDNWNPNWYTANRILCFRYHNTILNIKDFEIGINLGNTNVVFFQIYCSVTSWPLAFASSLRWKSTSLGSSTTILDLQPQDFHSIQPEPSSIRLEINKNHPNRGPPVMYLSKRPLGQKS